MNRASAGVAEGARPGLAQGPFGVRLLGRVDASEPGSLRFAWQGAGLTALVEGPEIAVVLEGDGTPDEPVYLQAVIDGQAGLRVRVEPGGSRSVTVASRLSPGVHRLELFRDTESAFGLTTFRGFSVGKVVGPGEPGERFVEVVGDSISAGYGNLGVEWHPHGVPDPPCDFSTENSSWYRSYAALAGRAVGAEVSTIACSGWGLIRDHQGSRERVLPAVYDQAWVAAGSRSWAHPRPASAIVINLGTNDVAKGDPGDEFARAYLEFIAHLRRHHPQAWMFLAMGPLIEGPPILDHLRAVLEARHQGGDRRISLLDFGLQDLGVGGEIPTGCNWHPSAAEHQRMAGILEQQLRRRLGW